MIPRTDCSGRAGGRYDVPYSYTIVLFAVLIFPFDFVPNVVDVLSVVSPFDDSRRE
jgi:hypothetical protein